MAAVLALLTAATTAHARGVTVRFPPSYSRFLPLPASFLPSSWDCVRAPNMQCRDCAHSH